MPLHKTITVSKNTQVYLWEVTEHEKELSAGIVLTDFNQKRLKSMKSSLHRRAFLSIRHAMALAGYKDVDLYYNEFGKPFLKDGTHISISHSHQFTGIIVSKGNEVGIDIEKHREKILRIAHKFTPLDEYRTIANTDALLIKLTHVWCAKEALYKIYGQPGLSFLQHIRVSDFGPNDPSTSATIYFEGKKSEYLINFEEFQGFSCAYAKPV